MKIFGIGLSKTGTNSLTQALEILGYKIAHYPPPDMVDVLAADQLDGCTDIPTALRFRMLDKKFPGSKFILTTREKNSWLRSIQDHYKRRPASTLNDWGKQNRLDLYGSFDADECDFEGIYDQHHKDVTSYFADRDDLLVLDLYSDDKWKLLCDFIGSPYPKTPYPIANEKPQKTQTVDAVYPYASAGAAWEELRYSIRSVSENFLDLRHIWIVGDGNQPWLQDVNTINATREYSDNVFVKNYDYTQMLLAAALSPAVSDPFLAINDDHYLLAPMTAEMIADRVLVREDMSVYTPEERATADTEWKLAMWEQYDRLRHAKLGGWNFECHTPVLVEKQKILHTWAFFGYGAGRLIWKSAYFNMFPPANATASLSESSGHKFGAYTDISYSEIKQRGNAAIYLNHNDEGLNDDLKRYIQERFPNPSPYEADSPPE